MLSTLTALAVVLALVFAGLTLNRALALWLTRWDRDTAEEPPSDRDLLLVGILPGLALLGTLGTYLAIVRLLRPEIFAAALIVLVLWRRRDALAVLRAIKTILEDVRRAVAGRDPIAILATLAFLAVLGGLLLAAQLPYDNRDIVVFQIPLARSMVEHAGFVYPQVQSLFFFSYNPLFFNLLFAEGLLFHNHIVTANLFSTTYFVAFMLALLTFFSKEKAAGLLVTLFVLAYSSVFAAEMPTGLADPGRICFSVLAIIFGYRYLQTNRLYYLVGTGLLAGAAVAGHYLELLTLLVLAACLLPRLRRGRQAWVHAGIFVGLLFLVGSYWYVRNWIVVGNPIWPLLFGHQGVEDYERFLLESQRPTTPEHFHINNNLATLEGWRDFAVVLFRWFLVLLPGGVSAALLIFGLVFARARVGMLLFCVATMFLLWYTVEFNRRWAQPAFLLYCATAIIASAPLIESVFGAIRSRDSLGANAARRVWSKRVAFGFLLALCVVAGLRFATHGLAVLPKWIDSRLVATLATGGSLDDYLARRWPGHAIYVYADRHHLQGVLQPFEADAGMRAALYNDGRAGAFVGAEELPQDAAGIPAFLAAKNVRYFIAQPEVYPPGARKPTAEEVARARRVIEALKPRSRAVLTDPFGWTLYEIGDAR